MMTDKKDIFELMKLPECAELFFKPSPMDKVWSQISRPEHEKKQAAADLARLPELIEKSNARDHYDRRMAEMQAEADFKARQQNAIQSPAIRPSPAPEVADEIAFDMVATRQQLIDAFGSFTGMSMEWFNNLNTSPRLKAARKYAGQGGRHSAEPLFCPYEVMQWLADPKRKKGRKLGNEKAWQLLKAHFPKAYTPNSMGDPNAD